MLVWQSLLFWQPSTQYISQFTVPAVEGFFRSIALSHGSSLQDTLRLLTLWFDYGQWPEVYDAIVEGIRTIEIDTWLQVFKNVILLSIIIFVEILTTCCYWSGLYICNR